LPFLTKDYYLNFFGGEPLLAFDLIKETTSFLKKENKSHRKRALYSITTNGSLFTEEIMHFLNKQKFSIEFSFDGLAQRNQRNQGDFDEIVSNIKELLRFPDNYLETNSVFTPKTVEHLSESLRFIMDLGVGNINLSLSIIEPWSPQDLQRLSKEMAKLRNILFLLYKKKGEIPVIEFREVNTKGIFYCAAGQDRLAITPEGQIWGCDLFADNFSNKNISPEYQKYFFGDLKTFSKNHKKIFPRKSANYSRLSMDNFSTPQRKCLFCLELEHCTVCPVNVAFAGYPMGKIPSYVCTIQQIRIKEKAKFWKELKA